MVEQRSPKPSVACSSRVSPAKALALPLGNARVFSMGLTDENEHKAPAKRRSIFVGKGEITQANLRFTFTLTA